jgi:hypothetical protein
VDPTAANALILGQRYPDSLKPTRSRASFATMLHAKLLIPSRLCSKLHISDPKRIFCPPKSRWRSFSSPFPSATPALFDRIRSSGGELRRAPLSVNLRG